MRTDGLTFKADELHRELKNVYWELNQSISTFAYRSPVNMERDLVALGNLASAMSHARKVRKALGKINFDQFIQEDEQ